MPDSQLKPGMQDRRLPGYRLAARLACAAIAGADGVGGVRLLWRLGPALYRTREWLLHLYSFRTPRHVPVHLDGAAFVLMGAPWSGVTCGVFWGGGRGFEPAETRLVLARAAQYSAMLDLGANVGWFSLVVCSANRSCRTYAFEPNPWVADILRRNLEFNGVKGGVVQAAAAERAGTEKFYLSPDDWDSSLEPREEPLVQTVEVETQAVDDFVKCENIKPDFIKIDVEGSELRVLRGARETLAHVGPDLLIELSPKITDVGAVKVLLDECGYRRFWTFSRLQIIPDDEMIRTSGRNTINYFTTKGPFPREGAA